MSVAGAIAGAGLIPQIMQGLDGLFTSKEEKLIAEMRLQEILQRPDLAQVEVNKQEAAHASIFVAGWRPAIGWTCAVAIAYHFVFHHFALWTLQVFAPDIPPLPTLQTEELTSLVMALLGLGSLRTFEKIKGVRESFKK